MKNNSDNENAVELRLEMVENQIRNRGIDRKDILQAFEEIPRHLFVPQAELGDAYGDYPLPISSGQTISQPYIVALMISYLNPEKHHRILEIGSGSGYGSAILSRLCRHIDAMEVYSALVERSRRVLENLSIKNISLNHRSAWEQFDQDTVYDRIILWASPPKIPGHLFDRLRDGGIMVAPEGKGEQYLWVFKRKGTRIDSEKRDAVRFVPLVRGSVSEIDGKASRKSIFLTDAD